MDPTKWIDTISENGELVEYLMAICTNCGQPYPSQRVVVVSDEEISEWNSELESNNENLNEFSRKSGTAIILGLLAVSLTAVIAAIIKLSAYYFAAVLVVVSVVYIVTLYFSLKIFERKRIQSKSIRRKILLKHNEVPAGINLNQVGLEGHHKYLLVSPLQYERYKMK